MPFTLVHAGKYRTEDKIETDTLQKLDNPEKANNATQNTTKKQNYPGSVASYNTRPGNEVDLSTTLPIPHVTLSLNCTYMSSKTDEVKLSGM